MTHSDGTRIAGGLRDSTRLCLTQERPLRVIEFSHESRHCSSDCPYEHDYDGVATWLLVQGRRITGEISEGTETAFLLRVFKGAVWVEAGATTDGKLQAMFMINF